MFWKGNGPLPIILNKTAPTLVRRGWNVLKIFDKIILERYIINKDTKETIPIPVNPEK